MKRLSALFLYTFLIAMASAATTLTAHAEQTAIEPQAETTPVTVSPPECEFQITFPGEPYTTRRCAVDEPDLCSELTSFTHVFGLDATVNFTFSCYKADEDMFERYTGDVMSAVLAALVSDQNLDEYQSGFQEDESTRQAVILGSGSAGNSDKLYMAQLWIGHRSVLTLEGEIIGDAHEPADNMFRDVIDSLRRKAVPAPRDNDKAEGAQGEQDARPKAEPAD